MCKVRCWRWLFGNQISISLGTRVQDLEFRFVEDQGLVSSIGDSGFQIDFCSGLELKVNSLGFRL